MSQLSRVAPMMGAGWPDLVDELDRWREAKRVATLWWRDDDAVAPSVSLDRLLSIAGKVPIALAVIPASVEPELAVWVSDYEGLFHRPRLAVLQHGWRHSNHSTSGKKSEFPAVRPHKNVALDLAAGRGCLAQLFGTRALPVLVPPWNRFDDSFLPLLGGCGIWGISRANRQPAASAVPGLIEVNCHIDLVAWADDRSFIGEGAALGSLVRYLRARRLGGACAHEPTGILTHHLVQDAPTDAFLRRLVAVTGTHPAARWLDAAEIFAPAIPVPA